jgi:hypothetical protein
MHYHSKGFTHKEQGHHFITHCPGDCWLNSGCAEGAPAKKRADWSDLPEFIALEN